MTYFIRTVPGRSPFGPSFGRSDAFPTHQSPGQVQVVPFQHKKIPLTHGVRGIIL